MVFGLDMTTGMNCVVFHTQKDLSHPTALMQVELYGILDAQNSISRVAHIQNSALSVVCDRKRVVIHTCSLFHSALLSTPSLSHWPEMQLQPC